jgi:hypothetical protein
LKGRQLEGPPEAHAPHLGSGPAFPGAALDKLRLDLPRSAYESPGRLRGFPFALLPAPFGTSKVRAHGRKAGETPVDSPECAGGTARGRVEGDQTEE